MHTGLAYSQEGGKAEKIAGAVRIDKEHKSRLKPKAVKALGSSEKYRLKLFSTGIFMMTQDELDSIKEIVIDQEWEGKEGQIKSYLNNFYKKNVTRDSDRFPEISVQQISNVISDTLVCHEMAYEVREGTIQADVPSNYRFLKGMILPSPGRGRKT